MRITLCAFADEAGASLEEQLSALRDNQIGLLELRRVDGKSFAHMSAEDAKECRQRLADNGIAVWAAGSAIGKVRQSVNMTVYTRQAERVCTLAAQLGTKNLRAFSFYPCFFRHDREKVFEKLGALLDIAEAHGLTYCLENEKGVYGSTAKRVEDILLSFPKLRMVYDPANFLQCAQPATDTLGRFLDRAFYFHVKDAIGKQVVPAGFGEGQIGQLVRLLDRDAVFSVEPHLQLFRGSPAFNRSELSERFDLRTARGRFDCAVAAFKRVLLDNGYRDCGTYFEKKEAKV